MLYMILYTIDIKGESDKKMQYSKLSNGVGSCLFLATCWGWVTKILCHYVGSWPWSYFFKEPGFHFLRPNPTLYFLTSPLELL